MYFSARKIFNAKYNMNDIVCNLTSSTQNRFSNIFIAFKSKITAVYIQVIYTLHDVQCQIYYTACLDFICLLTSHFF